MRKIHRIALAAQLKPLLAAMEPAFLPAKAEVAKALGTERRFTFYADYPADRAFLLFHPAATISLSHKYVVVAALPYFRQASDRQAAIRQSTTP